MKKSVKIGIGVLVIAIILYFSSKMKANANPNTTASTNPDGTPKGTPTPSKTLVPSVTVPILGEKLPFTYEGKPLYGLYKNKFTTGIGFLSDGTEITQENAMMDSVITNNYVKRISQPEYPYNSMEVDGRMQRVYERLVNKQISDYPTIVVIGFLEDGRLVVERYNASIGETYLVAI